MVEKYSSLRMGRLFCLTHLTHCCFLNHACIERHKWRLPIAKIVLHEAQQSYMVGSSFSVKVQVDSAKKT